MHCMSDLSVQSADCKPHRLSHYKKVVFSPSQNSSLETPQGNLIPLKNRWSKLSIHSVRPGASVASDDRPVQSCFFERVTGAGGAV